MEYAVTPSQPTSPLRQRPGAVGFALVELMIGVVIAILGLSGVYTATMQCSRMRRADLDTCLSMQACHDRIEEIRALPFNQILAQNGVRFAVDTNADGIADLRSPRGDASSLPGRVTVTTEAAAAGEVLYRVNVSVIWSGSSGTRTCWLETLMANRVRQ